MGSPGDIVNNIKGAINLGSDLGNKLRGNESDKAYVAGFALEKVAEILLLRKLLGDHRRGEWTSPIPYPAM